MAIKLISDVPYFQLTNSQRVCMGLTPVEPEWEWMRTVLEGQNGWKCWICFDGDIIRKRLYVGPETYIEDTLNEQTLDGRTKIVPRNGRNKVRQLSLEDICGYFERRPLGMFIHYQGKQQLYIKHNDSGRTYYSSRLDTSIPSNLEEFADWAKRWEAETTQADMEELSALLCLQKRQKQPYREGDFFRYSLGRRQFGYGRILMDYTKQRKRKKPFWDVLKGRSRHPLVVMPYRMISDSPDLSPEELRKLPAMPSFYMEDLPIAAGDYSIVGNLPLEANELDFPIHYGKIFPPQQEPIVAFQCGTFFRESEGADLLQFCKTFKNWVVMEEIFRSRHTLEHCIAANDNSDHWTQRRYELRNPLFRPNLKDVCEQIGVDIESLQAKLSI